jgi:lysophospholipase L1-like esterase
MGQPPHWDGGHLHRLQPVSGFGSGFGSSTSPPLEVACLGDSLTYGVTFMERPYPVELASLLGIPSCANYGVGGDYVAGAHDRFTRFISGRGFRVVVLCIGTNNITRGDAPLAIISALQSLADEIRGSGARLAFCTVPPRGTWAGHTPTIQATLEAVNGAIAAYATVHSEVTLVDLYSGLGDPGTPENLLGAFNYGDGLHENQAGGTRHARLVYAALRG